MNAAVAPIAAVICCYSDERVADICLAIASLMDQSLADIEVVVVVDYNENLQASLAASFPQVRVIANVRNRGLSGARNTGIAATDAPLVAFLDDDACADLAMLAVMTEVFADPDVLGVVAAIQPAWSGAEPTWFPPEFLWVVGCTYCGMQPGPVRNLIGAAMAVRRAVFDRVGGFDEGTGRKHAGLPLGCEETELCIRAGRAFPGARFVYDPRASCRHRVVSVRADPRYFLKRCWAEGLSKAHLNDLGVAASSLETERTYVAKVLPSGVLRGVRDALRGEAAGLGRATAIVVGLGATTAAYAFGRTRSLCARHASMLSNAVALASGTLVTALLGFAYWWLAARSFSPRAVGYAAAAMSMINLLGHLGEVGMGPFLIGHRGRTPDETSAVIATALSAVVASCGFAALGYLLFQVLLATPLGTIAGSLGASMIFVAAVALTGFTLVLDQALVGLSRSMLQMTRNVVASMAKLSLLVALAVVVGRNAGEALIFDTWVVGQALSLGVLALAARTYLPRKWPSPRMTLLRPLLGKVFSHHVLNVVLQIPALALPFIVTVVLSPATNAAFYAAWSLIAVALLVPASLATVVYSTVADQPEHLSARLKLSLALSGLACAVTGLAFLLFSQTILGLFSSAYPSLAGTSLQLLGFGTFGVALKYHYVALERLRGRMMSASLLLGLGACVEVVLATLGGRAYGLTGLTCGWLTAVGLEAVVVFPTLLRAIVGLTSPSENRPSVDDFDTVPMASEVA